MEAGNYTDVNGIKLYYELHGSGYPLVLLHGGGSTLDTTFGRIIPKLAETNRVIAIDLQNHGRSGHRDEPQTFEQDAADVTELLNQLQIDKANILGFSNGGQTAMVMGMQYPEMVNKLVIASAFYSRDGVFAGFWDGFEGATLEQMPKVYQDEFLKLNNNDHAGLQNMFNKDAGRMKVFKGWSADEIATIKSSALIVAGDRDLPSAEHLAEMSRLIKGSRLAILPGDHGSYMGEIMTPDNGSKVPELFVTVVNEFLADEA